MKFEIVKLTRFSGSKASIYAVKIGETTLFEEFILENSTDFKEEIKDIFKRIHQIGHVSGAQPYLFKEKEGKLGDGVEALYDTEEKKLRLYCIRYGKVTVILGGGGPKPEGTRAFQENEKLTHENYLLRKISKLITESIKNRETEWIDNDLFGKLIFDDDEEE